MKDSFKIGLGFGLTSGVITTLGLIVGLIASVNSKEAVIGGILTIAIADAFSDALGIHVSQESQNDKSTKIIWESTIATFISKLIFALTFIAPILLFEFSNAIWICIVWGFLLLSVFSFITAKQRKENPLHAVFEHLLIGVVVVVITYLVGSWIAKIWG